MAAASLEETAGCLAAGALGRTEADVQSDVRKFLLDAPLDLGGADLVDVALEAQAGGGRRIDVEAGCAAIEVKKSLGSPTVLTKAIEQLAGYVAQRTEELGQRYVGVLTDGQRWMLYHLKPDGELDHVDTFQLSRGEDADRLAAWLEVVLATTDRILPVPREIVGRLGAGSLGFQLDLADLRALYQSIRNDPEVRLKRELWARLLVAALGTNFEATDDLFVTHTWVAAQEGPFRLDDAGQRVERDATFQRVSYDVAVWVGAAPRSDQEARNGFERRLPFLDDYTPQVHPALERSDRFSEQPHEVLLNSSGNSFLTS